jgi:hypothetical protein
MNILLAAILLTNLLFLLIFCVIFFKMRSLYRDFVEFITPPDEGTMSPAAMVASAMADMLSKSIMMQAKTFFMGKESGIVRGETGIETDILMAKNPMLGMLLQSFPKLGKKLAKNPALIEFAMSKLGGNKPASAPVNHDGVQTNLNIG